MTTLNPYCLRLVITDQSAVSRAILPIAGDNIEKTAPISDSLYAWWRQVKGVILLRSGLFLSNHVDNGKACMASTKRPAALAKTSAAPRGRRVTLTLSEHEFRSLSYYAGRFRLTPQELLRGLIQFLPKESALKFACVLLRATKGRGR